MTGFSSWMHFIRFFINLTTYFLTTIKKAYHLEYHIYLNLNSNWHDNLQELKQELRKRKLSSNLKCSFSKIYEFNQTQNMHPYISLQTKPYRLQVKYRLKPDKSSFSFVQAIYNWVRAEIELGLYKFSLDNVISTKPMEFLVLLRSLYCSFLFFMNWVLPN